MFLAQLHAGCRTCAMKPELLLLGVSGGPDSVALLRGLLEIPESPPVHVVHVDHQLRPESAADAGWVQTLAEQMQVPVSIVPADVNAEATQKRVGTEEAARSARYRIFVEQARRTGATQVAVAHHANDNVETILHNIVRGTGLSGLAGMPPVRELTPGVQLMRPMLNIPLVSITKYLDERNIDFVEDATNLDTSFTRNRIRHELLPLLEREYNPQVSEAVLRLSRQARDASALVTEHTDTLIRRCCEFTDSRVRVRCDLLQNSPRDIVRSLMRQVWIKQSWPRQKMGFDEWDSLAAVVEGQLTGRDLPGGINASRHRATLTLRKQ